jgi:hypothetical protein
MKGMIGNMPFVRTIHAQPCSPAPVTEHRR